MDRSIFYKPVFNGPVTINNNIGVVPGNTTRASAAAKEDVVTVCPLLGISDDGEHGIKSCRDRDEGYKIKSNPKGHVLIINNEYFEWNNRRKGSQKDLEDMSDLWKFMGCDVQTKSNLTAKQLLKNVSLFSEGENDSDYYVVMIMSHGEKDDLVIGTEEGKAEVREIVNTIVRSNRMKSKPKLIFFQMCRGASIQTDSGDLSPGDNEPEHSNHVWISQLLEEVLETKLATGRSNATETNTEADASSMEHADSDCPTDIICSSLESEDPEIDVTSNEYIGTKPDTLLAFATKPDHTSFRDNSKGSWFIQSIKTVFSSHAKTHDVSAMMKMVKDEVERKIVNKRSSDFHGGKMTVDHCDTFNGKPLYLVQENHENRRKRRRYQ